MNMHIALFWSIVWLAICAFAGFWQAFKAKKPCTQPTINLAIQPEANEGPWRS